MQTKSVQLFMFLCVYPKAPVRERVHEQYTSGACTIHKQVHVREIELTWFHTSSSMHALSLGKEQYIQRQYLQTYVCTKFSLTRHVPQQSGHSTRAFAYLPHHSAFRQRACHQIFYKRDIPLPSRESERN